MVVSHICTIMDITHMATLELTTTTASGQTNIMGIDTIRSLQHGKPGQHFIHFTTTQLNQAVQAVQAVQAEQAEPKA